MFPRRLTVLFQNFLRKFPSLPLLQRWVVNLQSHFAVAEAGRSCYTTNCMAVAITGTGQAPPWKSCICIFRVLSCMERWGPACFFDHEARGLSFLVFSLDRGLSWTIFAVCDVMQATISWLKCGPPLNILDRQSRISAWKSPAYDLAILGWMSHYPDFSL